MADGHDKVETEVQPSHLEAFVGYNLKRAYVIVQNDFRRALGADGLAPRVFSALSLIVECPHISQSGLARMLGIERSGLVAIIDELETRGFIARTTVPGDRRVHALIATQAGQDATVALRKSVQDHEDALLSHLTKDEKQTLIALLQKIRAQEDK